ncbi:MAG: hypothetical protein LAN64_00790 [Acidobacteriia bacterium]|nr:hypothetical protein [Terriglobia bacterium]
MEMHITAQEQELLAEVLRQHQRELLREISHADHHDFKLALRARARLLEELLKKLDAPEPALKRAS